MTLLPEEVANKKFSVTYGRGYDRKEVDAFLKKVASSYQAAIEKIALVAEGREGPDDFGQKVELILKTARYSAEEIRHRAVEEAEAVHRVAVEKAKELDTQSTEQARRIIKEARDGAARLREASERESAGAVEELRERQKQLVVQEAELATKLEEIDLLVKAMRDRLAEAVPDEAIDLTEPETPQEPASR